MEAVVKYGKQDGMVEIREVPIPEIGSNEVLLKVKSAGICGSDIEMWHNKLTFPVNIPVVMGHEFCGVIEKVGKDVEDFEVGEKVVSETSAYICGKCRFCRSGNYHLCPERLGFGCGVDGAFTDYVRVRQEILHLIPENISFEEASVTEPLCVAYNAIAVRSKLSSGDTVVIIGPGAIGLNCLQVAKVCGAGELIIIGAKGDNNRLEVAKELGADICIDIESQDPVSIVMNETNEIGADLVIDAAGNSTTLYQSLRLVRRSGQITKIGWGPKPVNFSLDSLIAKSVSLQGSFSHNWQTWEQVLKLMKKGKLKTKPLISHILPTTEWKKGYQLVETKQAIKVLLKPVP